MKEAFGTLRYRKLSKFVYFPCGKIARSDLFAGKLRADFLHVDSQFPSGADGDKRQLVGVGNIKAKRTRQTDAPNRWFPVGTINEINLAWFALQVGAKQSAENATTSNKAISVAIRNKSLCTSLFIRLQYYVQLLQHRGLKRQGHAPDMDFGEGEFRRGS